MAFGNVYSSGSQTQQNAVIDDVPSYSHDYEGPRDDTRGVLDMADVQLGDFFSRPVEIYNNTWGIGILLSESFDPWSLFLNNKRVINRMTNYNFMRSTLHVKFVINGNPFFFGRMLASYLPFAALDDFSQRAGLIPENAIQETQCPHVFLDPSDSTGGSLRLPFYWYENNVSIPLARYDLMGRIYLRTLNALKHANGADDSVRITVFAWAENVEMSIPTSIDSLRLVPQMGELTEANNKGMISGPATAISRAAGELTAITAIAPFARATELGSGAVAKLAKAVGFCAPPITKDPGPVKPVPISTLALTDVPEQLQRLTIDSQQELTIDPAIAGVARDDPMNIKSIVAKESWLTKFVWSTTAPKDTMLFNIRVDPCLYALSGDPAKPAYHFPATAFAAMPFKYWTGSMKFRFQFVCSQYHRGRVRIMYDPNAFLDGSTENPYNLNYLEIVDLSEKNDFTMTVGPGQPTTYMRMIEPAETTPDELYGTTPLSWEQDRANGMLKIAVVNDLTVPNSTINNDIEVNVFVSAGDDFEVAVPTDKFQRFVLKPQMGVLEPQMGDTPDDFEEPEADMPEGQAPDSLGPDSLTSDERTNLVYFGETISSFRTLLKRYNLHAAMFSLPNASNRVIAGRRPGFPYYRGNVLGGVDQTATFQTYSYCNTVLLHWVTAAYSGWRGSIRWKIIPRGKIEEDNYQIYVQRGITEDVPTPSYEQVINFAPNYQNLSQAAYGSVVNSTGGGSATNKKGPPSGANGMAFTTASVQPNLEFEIPWYSRFRFVPGKQQNLTSGVFASRLIPIWDFRIFVEGDTSTTADSYCAAGEDFQVYFFTGLPPMYYEEDPPLPAP